MAVNGIKEEEKARLMEALHCLKSTSPPLFLSPSTPLSQTARSASLYLFSALLPSCPKSPFDRLLVEGFDAEQIWHQIDLQTKPLIANLRRDVKRLEANPGEIMPVGSVKQQEKEVLEEDGGEGGREKEDEEGEGSEEEDEGIGGFDEENGELDEEDDEEEEEEHEEEEKDEGGGGGGSGIEDRFFKIKELEEFLEKDEEREYGSSKEKDEDANEGEDGEDDEDDDEEVRFAVFSFCFVFLTLILGAWRS